MMRPGNLAAAGLVAAMMISAGPLRAQHAGHEGHQPLAGPQLGMVTFPTSCKAEARAPFIMGMRWLHSFEYEQAERSFAAAAAADPGCAIAQWGIAMTQYHPLWAPPTAAEFARGQAAIQKARGIRAGSTREGDYVAALSVFYDPALGDHRHRVFAYEKAMEGVSARNPGDREAGIFYALTLVASGMMDGDAGFTRQKKAAAILNADFVLEPDHPGIAHYLIHSLDSPALAPLALAAARRYADIAPDSAHAQHMPSHIFTRLGLWDEDIKANLRSEAAALAYARQQNLPGAWQAQLHATDYLVYSYLQTARVTQAREVAARMARITQVEPKTMTAAYSFAAVPARLALERKDWGSAATLELPPQTLAILPWAQFGGAAAHIRFARAIGAARSGNAAAAEREIAALAALRDGIKGAPGYDWSRQVEIERLIAQGWLEALNGRGDVALATLRAAADLDDATEKDPVTPGQILPAREELAELLLAQGRPAEALVEFDKALQRAPGRFNALYGGAHASALVGDTKGAGARFAALLKQSCDGDWTLPEITEASAFLGTSQARFCRTGS